MRVIVFLFCCFAIASHAEIHHAQGEMAGEVTTTTVLLQSRLTAIPGPKLDGGGDVPGAVGAACFEWSQSKDFTESEQTPWLQAKSESDFVVRSKLEGLQPGTRYHYRLVYGTNEQETRTGPARSFKTLPGPEAAAELSFCMGSCMNYHSFMSGKANGGGPVSATEQDKQLGYPSFAAMLELQPDFFIGAGDIVYYDHPAQSAARTVPELRRKWHEQFRFPRLIDFFSHTPAFWLKDDHDFRYNDADLGGKGKPDAPTGINMFREQLPLSPQGVDDTPAYRTHRVHKHLQLWFMEGRDYRSPNLMADGPGKSIWGSEQRAWLQETLRASDANWKVIVTPTPMVGPDRNSKKDNHTNLAGFKHEADSFFQWLLDNDLRHVMTFCGDRHWQYHSIHPLGVGEFSVGALNDENAIKGEKPGGPKTTDPEGKIRQPYLYPKPTGGFLHVTVGETDGSPRLRLRHYDDHGQIGYEVIK